MSTVTRRTAAAPAAAAPAVSAPAANGAAAAGSGKAAAPQQLNSLSSMVPAGRTSQVLIAAFNMLVIAAVVYLIYQYGEMRTSNKKHAQHGNHFAKQEIALNSKSLPLWDEYAEHRQNVTQVIVQQASQTKPFKTGTHQPTLAILGAGNLNDVNVADLLPHYGHITFYDIDADATEQGLLKQNMTKEHQKQLTVVACDLTGHFQGISLLQQYAEHQKDDKAIDFLINTMKKYQRPSEITKKLWYDVVVSTNVLTQINNAAHEASKTHKKQNDLVLAVRDQHLTLMTDLTAAGGKSVLITDVVSTVTLPQLQTAKNAELQPLLQTALNEQNFFTGTNPYAISRLLQLSTTLKGALDTASVQVMQHIWKWSAGSKAYIVTTVEWSRVS